MIIAHNITFINQAQESYVLNDSEKKKSVISPKLSEYGLHKHTYKNPGMFVNRIDQQLSFIARQARQTQELCSQSRKPRNVQTFHVKWRNTSRVSCEGAKVDQMLHHQHMPTPSPGMMQSSLVTSFWIHLTP